MYFKKSRLTLHLIAATVALSSTSHAFAADTAVTNFTPFWYAGAGLAADHRFSDVKTDVFVDTKTHQTITGTDSSTHSENVGWSLFTGYRVAKHWAFELGYYDQGNVKVDHTITSGGTVVTGTEKGHDYDVALSTLAMLPISDSAFSIYLRTGLAYHHHTDNSDKTTTTNYVAANGDEEGSHFVYGFGTEYSFSSHFSARAEYTLFDADALIQNLKGGKASLSAVYSF